MIDAEHFLKLILVQGLLFIMTDVDGSMELCPSEAVIMETIAAPDLVGFVIESSDVFPKHATRIGMNETFACPCGFKTCLKLCCPIGCAEKDERCEVEKLPSSIARKDRRISGNPNLYEFDDDPCIMSPKEPADLWARRSRALVDLSNKPKSHIRKFHLEGYSILRVADSSKYFIAACVNHGNVASEPIARGQTDILFYIGISISILSALACFIIYTVIPELKNLRGSIVRCYLASYIICIFMTTLTSARSNFLLTYMSIFDITDPVGYYFGMACLFWLNVMSIEIWRTFRRFESNQDVDIKKREEKKFVHYSIYAWISPAILVLVIKMVHLKIVLVYDTKWKFGNNILVLPTVVIGIFNICLYVSTALRIKQRKKETAHLVDGVNKHHKENYQCQYHWVLLITCNLSIHSTTIFVLALEEHERKYNCNRFNLYLKLFIIMGGTVTVWSVAWFMISDLCFLCVVTLEALQGILTFSILVWRDEVKRFFRKQFDGKLHTLCSCLSRDSTSADPY